MKRQMLKICTKFCEVASNIFKNMGGLNYDIPHALSGSTLRQILDAVDPTFAQKITNWGYGSDLNSLSGMVSKKQLIHYLYDNGSRADELSADVIIGTLDRLNEEYERAIKALHTHMLQLKKEAPKASA